MAIGTGAALLGSAVIGAASAANSSKQASKTANAQVGAADRASAEQARQYDLSRQDQLDLLERQRKDQQPWMDAGRSALSQLSTGMGEGGAFTRRFGLSDFQADPGYQFRMQQGEQGINRAAAARGGFNSGATLKALARFNSDLGSQEYGNAYTRFNNDQNSQVSRLQSLAGVGQSATNVIGQAGTDAYGRILSAGQNRANNIADYALQAGNARASGYVGSANAINSGIGQGLKYYQNQQMLDQFARSGGGFESIANNNQDWLRNNNMSSSELAGAF